MVKVARGEEPAFRVLARRHAARAIGFARRITGSDADAEEIVQEALLRVWINAPRWRPVAAFRTWFYRVVVNLCLTRRRRARFVPIEQIAEPVDLSPGPVEQIEREESDRRLAAAIARLPERQRTAITLTYDEGLSNADAAAVIGTSVSGLETLLVRAKRNLRTALGPVLDGND